MSNARVPARRRASADVAWNSLLAAIYLWPPFSDFSPVVDLEAEASEAVLAEVVSLEEDPAEVGKLNSKYNKKRYSRVALFVVLINFTFQYDFMQILW